MKKSEQHAFGILRSLFWPIHRSEAKRVISMILLIFLLCVCYGILRNLKDAILLTAKNSGAEAIPFIKVWGMLPAAFLATWVYTRLRRLFNREAVFHIIISFFVLYFLFFAFVLYPHSEQLHLTRLGDWLKETLPQGFSGLIALIRNWTFTSFYVISELWSAVVLSILYWGFANDVTEVGEAKRTYGILNIGSNIAPIFSGLLAMACAKGISLPFLPSGGDEWGRTIGQLLLLVAVLGVSAMGVYEWICRRVIPKEALVSYIHNEDDKVEAKPKARLSIRESIRLIARSKYLIPLAVIVLGYNISINLTDVLWKAQLKRFFSDPNEMLEHMNKITIGIGILGTVGGALFSLMVTRLGWTVTAIITPVTMTLFGIGFFTFLFCGDALFSLSSALFGITPFAMTVYFGSLQNCTSKACKYSIFDATKELAFLPLDPEFKLKGKAAIDGLGSGIGKSGSSLTYQSLIILLGSVALSTPYVAVVLCGVLVAWIVSVVSLGRQFKAMTTVPPVAEAPLTVVDSIS